MFRASSSIAPNAGGSVRSSFVGIPGETYTIESANNFLPLPTPWQIAATRIADGAGLYSLVDATPGLTQRFYRSVLPYTNNFNSGLGAVTLRGTAAFANGALMLTDTIGGQVGAVVFEGIGATPVLSGFTANFNVNASLPGGGTPADGYCFAAGDLGTVAWSEAGPGTANSLAVGFDTFNNGPVDGNIGIHVWVNGAHVAFNAVNPFTNGVTVPVEISFDFTNGLTVKFNGAIIFNNLAIAGFSFPAANGKFGIGARTGGVVERVVIDDVVLTPR